MIWMWIASLALTGLALLMCAAQYIYVFFYHNLERDGSYTFVPFIPGMIIFVGLLLLPFDLPMNRVAFAAIGMALDPSILCLMYLPFYLAGVGCKRLKNRIKRS